MTLSYYHGHTMREKIRNTMQPCRTVKIQYYCNNDLIWKQAQSKKKGSKTLPISIILKTGLDWGKKKDREKSPIQALPASYFATLILKCLEKNHRQSLKSVSCQVSF